MSNKPGIVWDSNKGMMVEPANNRLNRLLYEIGACGPARYYADGKNFQTMWEECWSSGWYVWLVGELVYQLRQSDRVADGFLREKLITIEDRMAKARSKDYAIDADEVAAVRAAVSRKALKTIHAAMLRVEDLKGTRYPRNAGPEELY